MTLQQLVKDALMRGGYDGLYNEAGDCACEATDLAPCSRPSLECRPGYRAPCECGDHDFHIEPRKPAL